MILLGHCEQSNFSYDCSRQICFIFFLLISANIKHSKVCSDCGLFPHTNLEHLANSCNVIILISSKKSYFAAATLTLVLLNPLFWVTSLNWTTILINANLWIPVHTGCGRRCSYLKNSALLLNKVQEVWYHSFIFSQTC